ncbi:alpha/beta-hydrolase [Mycena crocata]|nr:alpha/beta-hydrolase [Mycena crocata]
MIVTSHTVPGTDHLAGLSLVLKRYLPECSVSRPGAKSVTLLLTHCVGTHKETWEPVIEYLFQFQASNNSGVVIAEVWSADHPNHGEAAAVNEIALLERSNGISGHEWGRGIETILKSGLISSPNIVPIGHSAGSVIAVLSTMGYPLDNLPYSSMILVEPGMMTREMFEQLSALTSEFGDRIKAAVQKRTDVWGSRDEARAWFQERKSWKKWDSRVLEAFLKYGLRDLPTATYPNRADGVTFSCTRAQETAGYMHEKDGVDGNERLRDICSRIPVHCIFGAEIDLVPDGIHQCVCDAADGRGMASITKIPGAGHLVTQEKPLKLAQAIWMVLCPDNELGLTRAEDGMMMPVYKL